MSTYARVDKRCPHLHLYLFTDPPGPPEIQSEYVEGQTIRMGQTVSLSCKSRGGNPLPTVNWYKNGTVVDR